MFIKRVLSLAHAVGGGGDGAAARALPAVACRHQEAHRGAHRARVPRAHARRPQSLHLRRIGTYTDPLSQRSPTPGTSTKRTSRRPKLLPVAARFRRDHTDPTASNPF